MNVSELKKEIESDKAFIEKVADRIYKDTDDWEETIPEPEWIDRMTEIADRYLNRFETAKKLADKWIQSKSPQLNPNQQIVLDWLKENYHHKYGVGRKTMWALKMLTTNVSYVDFIKEPVGEAYSKLNNLQFTQVLQVFSQWALEQEEHDGN